MTSGTLEKILRWGIYVSLFLPLVIFSQYLSPFHFGKMVVFRSLVEIMAVFYLLLILIDKRYRPKWTLILISFSIYTALYVFCGLVGVNVFRSFWGTIERMGGIFSFLHFWVYFVILTSIIRSKKDWDTILKISVFVGFLSILFAYGQRLRLGDFFVGWQHGERVIGTIGNPALFAGYLLFIFYLALLFLVRKNTPINQKGFFAAVIILGIPVLLMTAVRGAILSLVVSLFLLGLFFIFNLKDKKIKFSIVVLLVLFVISTVVVFVNKEQSWVQDVSWLKRITEISSGTSTVQTRIWSWTSAIEGWKERPILGWGPENFNVLHTKYFDARHFTHIGSETIWDRAHNVFLNALATMGVVGLLSYVSILFFVFYFLIKKLKSKEIKKTTFGVLAAMLFAYVGQNLFIFDTFANYFLFFLVLGYINYIVFKDKLKIEETQIDKSPSPFLIVVLLVLALILVYQTNIQSAKANYVCTRAILAGGAGDAQTAVNKYQQALSYESPQGAYDIRHKLASFAISLVEIQRQKYNQFDSSILYYAIGEVAKNIKSDPLDTVPYLYIGRMYILLIDEEPEIAGEQALAAINKALDLNRNNPRIWYELGQAQMSLNKSEEAYESFKRALELNPDVITSWWFVGVAAYKLGNSVEAVESVEKAIEMGFDGYKNSLSDAMRLVQIYEQAGNYYKVIEYYNYALEESPDNAQIYASLAATYAKIGNYTKAVEAAQKAAEIDPEYQDEADVFIQSLGL